MSVNMLSREEDEKAVILDTTKTHGEVPDDEDSSEHGSLEEVTVNPNTTAKIKLVGKEKKTTNNAKDAEIKKLDSINQNFENKMWACQICTFAENPYTMPICIVCGALPMRSRPSAGDSLEAQIANSLANSPANVMSPPSKSVNVASLNVSNLGAGVYNEELMSPASDNTGISREDSNIDDIFEPNFLKQRTVHMHQHLENQLQKATVEKKKNENQP